MQFQNQFNPPQNRVKIKSTRKRSPTELKVAGLRLCTVGQIAVEPLDDLLLRLRDRVDVHDFYGLLQQRRLARLAPLHGRVQLLCHESGICLGFQAEPSCAVVGVLVD